MKPTPLSKLTAAQKRVAIAKDVVAQIKCGKILPLSGNYLIPRSYEEPDIFNQDTLQKQSCKVCGIGAGIVSGIRLFNKCETRRIKGGSPEDAAKIIRKWFTLKQAALIECCFETSPSWQLLNQGIAKLTIKEQNGARRFHNRYPNELKRALGIYKNIIRNKGQFIP